MVGNKAKKAIAAALSGAMVLSAAAPALAGVQLDSGWYRINGDHNEEYTLMLNAKDDPNAGTPGTITNLETVKGVDRYDTAFDAIDYNVESGLLANDEWTPGVVGKIIIASGTSQADSLVAAGLNEFVEDSSGNLVKLNVPVMITDGNTLSTPARRAIKAYYDQVKAGGQSDAAGNEITKFTVEVVGGEKAISESVVDAIKDLADDDATGIDKITVKRFAGADRSATSLQVAKKSAKYLSDEDGKKTIYVANGTAWPDALSVSSLAYLDGDAILLTGADGKLTEDQLAYLLDVSKSVEINVVGGPASPSVQQLFDAGFSRARVRHVAGNDRYETSAAVIEDYVAGAKKSTSGFNGFAAVAVANGEEGHWADALVGGPFVGANGGVLALVNNLDNVVALKEAYKAMDDLTAGGPTTTQTASSYIIGGEAAISADFADMLEDEFKAQ